MSFGGRLDCLVLGKQFFCFVSPILLLGCCCCYVYV